MKQRFTGGHKVPHSVNALDDAIGIARSGHQCSQIDRQYDGGLAAMRDDTRWRSQRLPRGPGSMRQPDRLGVDAFDDLDALLADPSDDGHRAEQPRRVVDQE